jgi:hypothetical protein
MPTTLIGFQIFLILLPGFTAAYVVQALATRRTQTDLERIIEAVVFSFLIYACDLPLNGGKLPFITTHETGGTTDDMVVWNPGQLGWLAVITVSFTFFALAYIRFDGNRIFRALKLTERTTRNSIWNDILEHEAIDNQPVQVEMADGRNVLGVLLYYSDASEDDSVYLKQAAWVDAQGQTTPIPGPGILLTKSCGIRSVSLLNPATDDDAEPAKPPVAEQATPSTDLFG